MIMEDDSGEVSFCTTDKKKKTNIWGSLSDRIQAILGQTIFKPSRCLAQALVRPWRWDFCGVACLKVTGV